jgi:hypothetical protein
MSDQVTDALERLRSETDQGCWTPSDWEEHAADIEIASDYALAATDGRPLTRDWLEAALGEPHDRRHKCDLWRLDDSAMVSWRYEKGIGIGWFCADYSRPIATPADAIAFFQLTRWPVSRAKIVEAWRKMG